MRHIKSKQHNWIEQYASMLYLIAVYSGYTMITGAVLHVQFIASSIDGFIMVFFSEIFIKRGVLLANYLTPNMRKFIFYLTVNIGWLGNTLYPFTKTKFLFFMLIAIVLISCFQLTVDKKEVFTVKYRDFLRNFLKEKTVKNTVNKQLRKTKFKS